MAFELEISFAKTAKLAGGDAVLLTLSDPLSPSGMSDADPDNSFERAARIADFKGKSRSAVDIIAPSGSAADRIVVIGLGKKADLTAQDWLKAGGAAVSRLGKTDHAVVYLDLPDMPAEASAAADFALGMLLRNYSFDRFKTGKAGSAGEGDADAAPGKKKKKMRVTLVTAAASAAKKAFADAEAIAGGVNLARELVNLPPNVLGPVEFAEKAEALKDLGAEVEILNEKDMRKLGMGALLGVAQGSVRPPRLAIIKWNGGKAKDSPVAFVGKGVVFDTGGISIKPAAGMEDMKGDMGGAAAVIGLLHALAARKAKVNAIGILGLVENMPDGAAQRPGDIVTSMSGQTIEIINTDAEGRLVLADALWYCQDRFKPKAIIDLATLTGAIMVALGTDHAGLFSNDDTLATQLLAAGLATEEKLWRMPLGKAYDKMIDSRFADMKNTGGRYGGSITAAQFLKRFVNDVPWAHLDVAGTAMDSPKSEISQSWASGFGVRLLDRLVRDNFEG